MPWKSKKYLLIQIALVVGFTFLTGFFLNYFFKHAYFHLLVFPLLAIIAFQTGRLIRLKKFFFLQAFLAGLLWLFIFSLYPFRYLNDSYDQFTIIAALLGSYFLGAVFEKKYRWSLNISLTLILGLIIQYIYVPFYPSQPFFEDQLVFDEHSGKQKVDVTRYKNQYWLYLNQLKNISTIDEHMYSEPMVVPTLMMATLPEPKVLVLGGDNGLICSELLSQGIQNFSWIPYDPQLTRMMLKNKILGKFHDLPKNMAYLNRDIFQWIEEDTNQYNIIYLDLPDPANADLNRFYTREFFQSLAQKITPNGLITTQAGSPYYSTRAYFMIENTLNAAGFHTIRLHNHVPSIGPWGWIIASEKVIKKEALFKKPYHFEKCQWLSEEALQLLTSFGKPVTILNEDINTIDNPLLYKSYIQGTWDIFRPLKNARRSAEER